MRRGKKWKLGFCFIYHPQISLRFYVTDKFFQYFSRVSMTGCYEMSQSENKLFISKRNNESFCTLRNITLIDNRNGAMVLHKVRHYFPSNIIHIYIYRFIHIYLTWSHGTYMCYEILFSLVLVKVIHKT